MGETDETLIEAIGAELRERRATCVPLPNTPGVYAYFLRPGVSLDGVTTDADGLLYIGKTTKPLSERDHLSYRDSGSSSLRRTFGALLKSELRLQARPRGRGSSAKDCTHYRFSEEGEQCLTRWMQEHLLRASYETSRGEVSCIERGLIRQLRPPLNLRGCTNPLAAMVGQRRGRCAAEAAAMMSCG